MEISESPPRALARALALTIGAFFATAIVWAALGRVDIVAVAEGRIVPVGQIKTVQPLYSGVVRTIHIREGEHVVAGQRLVELDASEVQADRHRAQMQFEQAEMDRAIALALLSGDPPTEFQPPSAATPAAVGMARDLIAARWQNQVSALAENAAEAARMTSALAAFRQQSAAHLESVEELETLLSAIAMLETKGLATKSQVTNLKLQLIGARGQMQSAEQQMTQAELSLGQNHAARRQLETRFFSEVRQQLATATQNAMAAEAEMARLEERQAHYVLTAPVTGLVNDLTVHTIGAVVEPSQTLMMIIPEGVSLEVEAQLSNKDVGFVEVGNDVEIKLESFPFTRYGTLHGTVTQVAADAHQDPALGPVYVLRALPESLTPLSPDGLYLGPGMRATVEIKTGERAVLDYFLAPLLRFQDEAIRER